MDALLTRTGEMPVTHALPQQARSARRALGHVLLAMAHATADGLILPQRGLRLEWFRFPLP
jgi:hypothetical protein